MTEGNQLTIEERVMGLERAVTAIAARLNLDLSSEPISQLDNLTADSIPKPDDGTRGSARPVDTPSPKPNPRIPKGALSGKSAEWWLARGGALLTCFALVLLYQYAVDQGWITPIVRLFIGGGVGGALMYAGLRLKRDDEADERIGVRPALLGAGLAAWYLTVYAAGVWYQLISLPTSRLLLVALSIGGAWLALRERKSPLALLALGIGFATPAMIPTAPSPTSIFTIYVAALSAVGLVLYLMRGWQSVLWLTFIAFWLSILNAPEVYCCGPRVAALAPMSKYILTVVIVAMAAASVRVPILRRRLLALGSRLYTPELEGEFGGDEFKALSRWVGKVSERPHASDSFTLWAITLMGPVIASLLLANIWPSSTNLVWGAVLIGAALLSHRFITSATADDEFAHVIAAAAALWSLCGLLLIVSAVAGIFGWWEYPLYLIVASAHSYAVARTFKTSNFLVPLLLARAVAFVAVGVIVLVEQFQTRRLELLLTAGELASIAVAGWMWHEYRSTARRSFAVAIGITAYVAILIVDARVLGGIWPPLVTASYALAGAAIFIASRRMSEPKALRQIGGVTLLLVVGRLMIVDLVGVATIWRVALFLGCGALFLLTSYGMQSQKTNAESEILT